MRTRWPGPPGDGHLERAGEIALWLGLLLALVSMTTAMAQIERGLNRIYGIRRDRPAPRKYGRAAVLTLLLALPVGVGFLLLVAGGAFADAMVTHYGWSGTTADAWNVARWPVGVVLMVVTIAVVLNHAPRRRQPGLSWLAAGAAVAVVLNLASTGLLALYVQQSGSFGDVYGPAGRHHGAADLGRCSPRSPSSTEARCAPSFEACRAGRPEPAYDDPGRPGGVTVS